MTTITACEYSPISGQPLTRLDPSKIELLNKKAQHDITDRIRTVVQRHLDYQGTETFRATFTKQQILFTLTTGTAVENRTLKYENNRWMLSKDNAAAIPLNPALQNEVNSLINEILYRIGQAHNTGSSPVPALAPQTLAPISLPSTTSVLPPTVSAPELIEIKERLADLEALLRNPNPTFEGLLQVQQRIEELLTRLIEVLGKTDNSAEKDALRGEIEKLHNALSEVSRSNRELRELLERQKDFETHRTRMNAEFYGLQNQLASARQELTKLQKDNAGKDQAVLASEQKVAALEAIVVQQEAQIKKVGQEFEAFKTQAARAQEANESELAQAKLALEQLKAQLDKAIRTSEEKFSQLKARADSVAQEYASAAKKQEAEFSAQKAALEEQLAAAKQSLRNNEYDLSNTQSELNRLKETHERALAELNSQLGSLREQKALLEQTLAASSSTAQSTNGQLVLRIIGLEQEIQEKAKKLEQAAQSSELNQNQIRELENRLRALEVELASKQDTVTSLKSENQQLKNTLDQTQKELKALQQANESNLARAATLQQLKDEQATIIQDLKDEINRLTQAVKDAEAAQQEQSTAAANATNALEAALQSIQLLESNTAKQTEQLQKITADLLESQSALTTEQENARQMEASFNKKLASQTKIIDGLKAKQTELETQLQDIAQERDEARRTKLNFETCIQEQANELRELRQRLQDMRTTKQKTRTEAEQANAVETTNLSNVEREIADLMKDLNSGENPIKGIDGHRKDL
jgi:chromosome segregation ATPase